MTILDLIKVIYTNNFLILVFGHMFKPVLLFQATVNLSPDSPNKKRKPGRPKKCDVVRPGVTGKYILFNC